ncbi:hypothetical protein EXN22_17740 [Pseudomonas tructae]|uniref:Uncharacterized protein n=1 Tax=Pseudomonas tructae TaxID=2518644 RepID=A0A411MKZ3_9PSED|nr:hypothetical protein [Pseudomonas tructae]QBF27437.1 hypothetical protein EXN22_17740 [Pseudomonas tructae]
MATDLPQAWVVELDDQVVEDPDGRAAVLSEMAYAAHWQQEIDEGYLLDILELAESVRVWSFLEIGASHLT